MRQRYRFAGGTAVVTGAASGIGAALARALAARGSHLVLLDSDGEGLAAVAEATGAASPDVRITTYVVDLADPAATARTGETLADAHRDTTLLVNNAGVALGGRFDQVSAAQFDAVLAVNLHAVITLTRALLPVLAAHPGAHLVTLSSIFGILAPAGQTAYCTSKFAARNERTHGRDVSIERTIVIERRHFRSYGAVRRAYASARLDGRTLIDPLASRHDFDRERGFDVLHDARELE